MGTRWAEPAASDEHCIVFLLGIRTGIPRELLEVAIVLTSVSSHRLKPVGRAVPRKTGRPLGTRGLHDYEDNGKIAVQILNNGRNTANSRTVGYSTRVTLAQVKLPNDDKGWMHENM